MKYVALKVLYMSHCLLILLPLEILTCVIFYCCRLNVSANVSILVFAFHLITNHFRSRKLWMSLSSIKFINWEKQEPTKALNSGIFLGFLLLILAYNYDLSFGQEAAIWQYPG